MQCRRPWFNSLIREILWRRDRLPTTVFLGFPSSSDGKESTSVQDWGSIPGLGKSHAEVNGYPLQYSGLENSMDRGAWQATQGVTKSQTQLSNLHFFSGSWSSTLQSCSSNHYNCLPYLLLDRNSGLNRLSFAQNPESYLVMDYLYRKASAKEAATLLIEMFSY